MHWQILNDSVLKLRKEKKKLLSVLNKSSFVYFVHECFVSQQLLPAVL